MGSIVPIVAAAAARRQRVVDAFRSRQALSPEQARPLPELGLSDLDYFARLRAAGVIREAGSGRYYLDLTQLQTYDVTHGRAVLRVGLLIVGVVAAAWLIYTLTQK